MKILEFLADVEIIEGETDETVESATCIDRSYTFQYFYVIQKGNKFYFQYINLYPKASDVDNETFELLENAFYNFSEYEICRAVKILMNTELQNFQRLNETFMRNPFYSIRGTCNKRCLPRCLSSWNKHWCKNKVIGYTGIGDKYPDSLKILGDIVKWYCSCPDMDMVFIMHDYYPDDMKTLNFQYGFCVKDRVIRMVDSKEAERLYQEYNQKYPIDLKETEEWIEYMNR